MKKSSQSDVSSGTLALISLNVSYNSIQYPVTIPSQATFGELKRVLAQETGLQPQEQRLLFRGKEKEDNDYLHIAGVRDQAKIFLVEDPAYKERKLQEINRNEGVSRACEAVARVQEEVDKLTGQFTTLEKLVNSRKKVDDREFVLLSELLMRQILKLDSIDAEGEAKLKRKIEVKRIQTMVDALDGLKVRNSNPLCSNGAVVATQWETFDSGVGTLTSPPPPPSSEPSTDWEVFE